MSRISFRKMCWVPVLCYLPAGLFVVFSFFIFKPGDHISKDENTTKLEDKIAKEIKEEVEKEFARQTKITKLEGSSLAKDYLTGQIKVEAKEQAEKASADEINKMKADLFSDFSFPVLFTIASIFAAFAVKDILVEILKEQEKEKIKEELILVLTKELSSNLLDRVLNDPSLDHRFKDLEDYTYWLEHELLTISANQIFDELKYSTESGLKEKNESLCAIEQILSRSKMTLNRISEDRKGNFQKNHLKQLEKAERYIYERKISSIGLEKDIQDQLFKILKKESQSSDEDPVTRMDDIFQVQMNLLISTLSKLPDTDDLIHLFKKYLSKDAQRSPNDKNKEIIKEIQNIHWTPPDLNK